MHGSDSEHDSESHLTSACVWHQTVLSISPSAFVSASVTRSVPLCLLRCVQVSIALVARARSLFTSSPLIYRIRTCCALVLGACYGCARLAPLSLRVACGLPPRVAGLPPRVGGGLAMGLACGYLPQLFDLKQPVRVVQCRARRVARGQLALDGDARARHEGEHTR